MVIVLLVTGFTAGRNTFDLLQDKAQLLQGDLLTSAQRYLLPAEAIPRFLAEMIEAGTIDRKDPEAIANSLMFALAGAPQVQSVTYLYRDGWMTTVFRDAETQELGFAREAWTDNVYIAEALQEGVAAGREAYWGEPLYIEEPGRTFIYFAHIIRDNNVFESAIAASIELSRFSNFMEDSAPDLGDNTFIITADDRVIVHREIGRNEIELTADDPVPTLEGLADPALRSIWAEGWEDRELDLIDNGHANELDEGEFIYLYQPFPLEGLAEPWLIGGYLGGDEASAELRRLGLAGSFGLILVLLTTVLAFKFARQFAEPTMRLAEAAGNVERLEFDQAKALPQSRLKEVDTAFRAFERMTAALSLFGRYVPKRLVQMLVDRGDEALLSEQRDVTIVFADIVGFTQLTAEMRPQDCAAFLNDVFTDLTAAIEAENGTVDKFIGDCVMAFWGAPEPQPDHAARACRAALAMRRAVQHHNDRRQIPYSLRIGIHSGRVTVGNIGPASRINYTIVGTPVNTAQRLQELGKIALADETVAILTTHETIEAAGLETQSTSLGTHQLDNGGDEVEVFRL